MSRNYVAMTQSVFDGQAIDVDGLVAHLATLDADAAEMVAGIDWKQLQGDFAAQALKDVALQLNLQLNASYDNKAYDQRGRGTPPDDGRVLGVLSDSNGVQLGVSMSPNGTLHYFHNDYSSYYNGPTLTKWKEELRHRYNELGIQGMLSLVGESVQIAQESGSTTFVATLPEKVGQ